MIAWEFRCRKRAVRELFSLAWISVLDNREDAAHELDHIHGLHWWEAVRDIGPTLQTR